MAVNLYVTLVNDTGRFRFPNTTPEVFRFAAEWVAAGARPDQVSRAFDDSAPPEKLKLLARVLATLELSAGGRIGLMTLTRGMLEETGAVIEMADDFVDYPRSIATVEAAAFFRESPEGWRVSLRSKDLVDVGKVATDLGGGGHVRAAGFTLPGDFASVRDRTVAALADALRKSPVYKRKTAC
jgi:phosphoesterase RecJ-like protein